MTLDVLMGFAKQIIRIVKPWKKNYGETEEYRRGWNDCVLEVNKNQKRYLVKIKTVKKH